MNGTVAAALRHETILGCGCYNREMAFVKWFWNNWFELIQTVGIIASFGLAAFTAWKEVQARRIGNSIAISNQHREIWKAIYGQSEVARVLDKNADVKSEPLSIGEELFVTALIAHLSTVFRAMKHGEFVKLEGLRKDVQQFFGLPIPNAVWNKLKPLQDNHLVVFIESCLRPEESAFE